MPELSSSGEIFTLDGSAGFDEGIVRGDVGGGARLTYDGHFELCHGLDAALSAEAIANIQGQLSGLFILTGLAQGDALAAAGVSVDAAVQFDIFDSFGLTAAAEAYAEASVAGRISAGFTFEDLAAALRPLLDNLAYDIAIYFLNEIDAAGGVWGKAAFAAMAKARLKVKGSLRDDDDAGFVAEFGAEVGWGAGAGYDGYITLRLRNPKRFYLNSVERIAKELATQATKLLPPDFASAIHTLELCLPIALNAAYELGQSLPLSTIVPPEQAAKPFIDNFVAQLRRFTLDKLTDAAFSLARGVVEQFIQDAVQQLTDAERDTITHLLDTLIADLEGSSPPDPIETASRCAEVLLELAPDLVDEWRQPMTIAWVAAAAVSSLRFSIGGSHGSVSAGLVGLGTDPLFSGATVKLPEPTGAIAAELNAFFDPLPPSFELTHAVAYLTGTAAESLYTLIPGLHEAIEPLLAPLGLSGSELLRAALQAGFGDNFAATELYQHLRKFLKDGVDTEIEGRLIPALRAAAPGNSDFAIWLDEAAEPSLLLLSGFVFDRLDVLVGGGLAHSDVSPFMESFRSALSAVVSQIVVRNVVAVADVLREHIYTELSQGFHTMSTFVAQTPNSPVARAAGDLVRSLVPANLPLPSNYAAIAVRLVADMFDAASDGFDPVVLSDARRRRLRQLEVAVMLSIDGTVNYKDPNGVNAFFRQAAECLYIPAPDESIELVSLQVQILAEQAQRMYPKVDAGLRRFFMDLTAAGLDDLDRGARAFLDDLLHDVQVAWDWLQTLIGRLSDIANDIRRFEGQMQDDLNQAADALRSPSRRSAILDDVADAGAAEARREARQVPGFGLLPAAQQRDAQNAAEANLRAAFSLVRPVLNEALKVLGAIADDLAQVLQGASDLDDALTALGQEVINRVEAEVRRQLGILGVFLPAEITPDTVAQEARDFIKQLPPLRTSLQAWVTAMSNRAAALVRQQTTTQQRDAARDDHNAKVARRQEELGGPLAVEILSPLPLAATNNWAYRNEVLLRLRIKGARLSFLDAGQKRRVRILLNGALLNPPPRDWKQTSDGLSLTTSLTAGTLRRGVNTIECSVTNGNGSIKRAVSRFAFQPLPALTPPVDIDQAASSFGRCWTGARRSCWRTRVIPPCHLRAGRC